MVQVARLAPNVLEDSTPLVTDFLRSQMHPSGGFCDRSGSSDLYYSMFGIEGLQALQQTLPETWLINYVDRFRDIAELDLVHVSSLCRCWNSVPNSLRQSCPIDEILHRLEQHQTPDGGYDITPGSPQGSLYGTFVAYGAMEDLGARILNQDAIGDFVESLRDPNGGYFNSLALPISLVPQTAGAIRLLQHLDRTASINQAGEWLLSCFHPQGGFCASQLLPIPDLLSTATALHAISNMHADLSAIAEPCLDFVDSLWTNKGGFYGQWEDTHADVEYTYYALLALGHLSLL